MTLENPATCDLCGTASAASRVELDRLGWDWFTGWLPATVFVYPACMRDRRPARDRLLDKSRIKPPSEAP